MSEFLAAIQFLTLLPVKRSFSASQVGRSSVYFPLIGLLIGLVLAGINYVLTLILPVALVNALLLVCLAIFSGGLHLDGFADTMDGMAGQRTAERRLEIMRDSRIGGAGATALVLLLLVQFIALNSLPEEEKTLLLIVAPVAGRWAMVNAIFVYPYARKEGLGSAFKAAVNWKHFLIATCCALLFTILVAGPGGLLALAFGALAANLSALFFRSRLNGLTGDTYGAINEIVIAAVWIISIILVRYHLIHNWWF